MQEEKIYIYIYMYMCIYIYVCIFEFFVARVESENIGHLEVVSSLNSVEPGQTSD